MVEKLPIELIMYSFKIANLQTLLTLGRTCSEFNIITTDILRNRTHTKKGHSQTRRSQSRKKFIIKDI